MFLPKSNLQNETKNNNRPINIPLNPHDNPRVKQEVPGNIQKVWLRLF